MTRPTDAMHPARWRRIEALFDLVVDAAPSDRVRLLRDACADDPSLVSEVLGLIDSATSHPDFLEVSLVDASRLPDAPLTWATGELTTAGARYRLIERVGEGGMAEVFRAVRVDDADAIPVAVKVMRRGLDTDVTLRRFRLETRILATLSHPHIAPLLDSGATPDGRPFVVMPFVAGAPLVEWCDARRLSVAQRLALVRQLCAAVQHAHQHFIVHRDIKPSNVLVTEDGTPVLLDFGIGKVLQPDAWTDAATRDTTQSGRVLTPDYAAPEQLRGGAVSTATDVYALGVLLCELLTGALPWPEGHRRREHTDRDAPAEVRRPSLLVTEDSAAARGLSARDLTRRLSGDLDTIVLTAIRDEPARRYPTAVALADDLQRYLEGRPVLARTDSAGYRLQKFVRRNRVAVSAGVVTASALLVAAVMLVRNERLVRRTAERVAVERDRAREVRTFLLETFGASGADRAVSDTVSVRRLLDLQAAQTATRYGTQPALHADMLEALAEAYDRLGLAVPAESLAARAVQLRRRAGSTADTLPDALANAVSLHGWLLHAAGRPAEAVPLLQEAITRRRGVPDAALGLSRSLNDLGVVYNATARYAEAETTLTEALALREQLLGADDRAVGITANNLAATYFYLARYDSAAAMQARALRALSAAYGLDHQRTVVALANLATFRRQAGDRAGAEREYRELLARHTRVQGAEHPVTARVMTALAQVRLDAATPADTAPLAEAEQLVRDALRAFRQSLGPTHPDVGKAMHQLATIRLQRGDVRDAAQLEAAALPVLTAAVGPWHPSTLATRVGQARVLRASGDVPGAVRLLTQLRTQLAVAPAATPGLALERARVAVAHCEMLLAARNGRAPTLADEATTVCRDALRALPEGAATPPSLRRQATALRDSAARVTTQ
ncbi:MAG: serine/threonine-protein kinase [Gemmatimonadetes bacterium]|nr:serine/threonine-protein kinase [Gemmatimonadota bacterium]